MVSCFQNYTIEKNSDILFMKKGHVNVSNKYYIEENSEYIHNCFNGMSMNLAKL